MSDRLVTMTRRVTFSSGHRYWLTSLSEAENRALYGKWASPFNHGHNYVLDVSVRGAVVPPTGMVVNIKTIDDILRSLIVSQFDQKSINDEIPHFADRSSSLENLMLYVVKRLEGNLPSECQLIGVRLEEMPLLYGEYFLHPKPTMTLTRVYEFAAAHRLDSAALSPTENIALYGKCNNFAGHGHNYVLEVSVGGTPDPTTGMLADLTVVDQVVKDTILDRYDHKNLNVDLPEFAGRPTTSEVVAQQIFDDLAVALPYALARVRLHETARNIFEVTAA